MTIHYSHGGYGWNQQLREAVPRLHAALLSYGLSDGRLVEEATSALKSLTPQNERRKGGGPNGI